MKELSIEEKAKRYDEAIEIAKEINNEQRAQPFNVITKVFPELAESEDERIRKGLLYVIEHHPTLPTEEAEEYIAWLEKQGDHANFRNKIKIGDKVTRNEDGVLVNLSQLKRVAKKDEKQGEQKPTEWSEKDEDTLHCIIDALDSLDIRTNTNGEHEDHTEEIYWLKSLKDRVQPQPKQEWSEEDIVAIDCAVEILSKDLPSLAASIERLKSLRPQNTWKPSEGHLKALEDAMNKYHGSYSATLCQLYGELEKLREE